MATSGKVETRAVTSAAQARAFAQEFGFPIHVLPAEGVTSSGLYLIHNATSLERFVSAVPASKALPIRLRAYVLDETEQGPPWTNAMAPAHPVAPRARAPRAGRTTWERSVGLPAAALATAIYSRKGGAS